MSSRKTIAIVGAGVSGLQVARTILTSSHADSFDVVIFEAKDRIGGRVKTKSNWGFPLDYGANFIHGTDQNPLSDIASKVKSTFVSSLSLRRCFDGDGHAVDAETAGLIFAKTWEYSAAASDHSRWNDVDKNQSVDDFFRQRLREDKDLKDEKTKYFVGTGLELHSSITACDLDKLSLKYYWMEDDLPGDRPFLDSTYYPIVEYIAQPALSQSVVKLNTKICSINVDPTQNKPITLTSSKHETFHADSVVVTIPLGCLKRDDIKFIPPLPLRVQKALSNLSFGVLEKLFIRFSEAWWLSPVEEEEEEDLISIEFYRFTSLRSLKSTIPEGSLNFFSLARTHCPQPVFGIYISTELAKYLVTLSKDSLKTMLQTHFIPLLPNYDVVNPACQILEVDSSSWSQDPLAGFGSYTHIPVGSDTGDEDMEILSEKVLDAGDGGIWFAGEHTANTELRNGLEYSTMGTVTGAYKSGERAGIKVLEHYTQ